MRCGAWPGALRGLVPAQALRGWRMATQDCVAPDAARQTEFSQLDARFDLRDGVGRSTDLDGRGVVLRVGGEGRIDHLLRARVVNAAGEPRRNGEGDARQSAVWRGATGVVRDATGVLRSVPGALPPGQR